MPRLRRNKTKYPKGFEVLEETLEEFETKMREAVMDSHEGKRKNESIWPILKINHQRTRYIYEMYYKQKKIDRKVYEFTIRMKYADSHLIAKWKKKGYERLCCMQCITTHAHSYNTVCICRVPNSKLHNKQVIQCTHCGCRGCASGD